MYLNAGGYSSGVQRIDYIIYRYLGQPGLGIHSLTNPMR